jgi:hypothetical protein
MLEYASINTKFMHEFCMRQYVRITFGVSSCGMPSPPLAGALRGCSSYNKLWLLLINSGGGPTSSAERVTVSYVYVVSVFFVLQYIIVWCGHGLDVPVYVALVFM